jgi:hypothetical protein
MHLFIRVIRGRVFYHSDLKAKLSGIANTRLSRSPRVSRLVAISIRALRWRWWSRGEFWFQLDGQPEKVLRAGESLTTPDRAIHNEGALGQAVKLTAV